jgi:hypothetical protein
MPFRQTIAAKIFGLAIILLLLTIALAGFLLYEVTRTKQDLTIVANFDVPLTQSLARLHEFGLRRRLAFERWFGALNAAEPNREIVAEATENYTVFTRKLTDEFLAARQIIEAYPRNGPGSHTLAEVETLLDQIQPAYKTINNRQREVLDMQLAGQHDKANQQLNLLNDLQSTVQNQREAVNSKMAAWSDSATKATATRATRILVNNRRYNIHSVVRPRGGSAYHKPAEQTGTFAGHRHARCPGRQSQYSVAGQFY